KMVPRTIFGRVPSRMATAIENGTWHHFSSQVQQRLRVLAEDLRLLAFSEVLAAADRRDRVRVFRIEVRIVRRHEDAVLAQLRDGAREVAFVRLARHPAVA